MYLHILIPVELGDTQAYKGAIEAASKLLSTDGKITLLNAIEPIPAYAESYILPDLQLQCREGARQRLDALASGLGVENTALVFGSAGRSIVDWAEENSADCIVVQSHKPEFSDFFLGSTAAWVVRHTKKNVLVLR